MKIPSTIIAALGSLLTAHATPTSYEQFLADQKVAKRAEKSEAGQRRLDWWRDARFGMFIHWGPSSLAGSEISLSKQFYDDTGEHKLDNPRPSASPDHPEHRIWFDWFGPPVPRVVYDNLHKSFYPGMFDAEAIVKLAKDAGMKYIVPVAKHCDGFSMWDSAFTDYDMMATPFKRDIIGELAKACERAGMKFGIYYQQRDWHHPDYGTPNMARYNEFMYQQIKELLERCPNISILWFDAHEGYPWETWNGDKLYRMIHQLRPDIIINDRCGLPGDFYSPEQMIGSYDLERDWESNMTFSGTYSWSTFHKPVIPIEEVMGYLVRTAGGNGNLLMNVGPMPTGQIDPRDEDRLRQVGKWMKVHGESIYGTKGGPYKPTDRLAATRKGNTIYLHVMKWPESGNIQLPPIDAKLVKAALMNGGLADVRQSDTGLEISVAPESREPVVTTVAMQFDRCVMDLVLDAPPKPISEGKPTTASSVFSLVNGYDAARVNDGSPDTRWASEVDVLSGWIAIDLGAETEINRALVSEIEYPNTREFAIEVKQGTEWKEVARGTTIGKDRNIGFSPTKAREVRLKILKADSPLNINEFQVFSK